MLDRRAFIQLTAENTQMRAGFTLTEITIVLGIIGIILSSIWVAAGTVYNNLRINKAQTELLQITQAIRSLYPTHFAMDVGSGTDETLSLIAAKVFPSDTMDTSNGYFPSVVHGPWDGSFIKVFSATQPTNGLIGDSFQIMFVGIPSAACIALATIATGAGRDQSLIHVGFAPNSIGNYITPTTTYFPIYSQNAVADTNCGTGGITDIAFTYTLRG